MGTEPGSDGQIAVVKDHIVRYPNGDTHYGNGTGVFVVSPNGSRAHWFFDGRGHDPSWSPDGKTLLFTRTSGLFNYEALWTADQRGQHQTKISGLPDDLQGSPADWSPNGMLVISGGKGLYVATLVGSAVERVHLVLRGEFDDAVWSPKASEIAFRRLGSNADELMVEGTDGGNLHAPVRTTK
jgi:Tol biopolymer transport system component